MREDEDSAIGGIRREVVGLLAVLVELTKLVNQHDGCTTTDTGTFRVRLASDRVSASHEGNTGLLVADFPGHPFRQMLKHEPEFPEQRIRVINLVHRVGIL